MGKMITLIPSANTACHIISNITPRAGFGNQRDHLPRITCIIWRFYRFALKLLKEGRNALVVRISFSNLSGYM